MPQSIVSSSVSSAGFGDSFVRGYNRGDSITADKMNESTTGVNSLRRDVDVLKSKAPETRQNLQSVPIKIGSSIAVGKYNATEPVYSVVTQIAATGALTAAEMMQDGAACILAHAAEVAIGATVALLKSGTIVHARYAGRGEDGLNRFIYDGVPVGETASPTVLTATGSSLRSTTWSRATNGTPLTQQCYRYYCDGSGNLIEVQWTEKYDACGLKIEVGAESI